MLNINTRTIEMMLARSVFRMAVKSIAGDQAANNVIILGYFMIHHNSDGFGCQGRAPNMNVIHQAAVHHAGVRGKLTFRSSTNEDPRLIPIFDCEITRVRAGCGPVDEEINMLRTGSDDDRNMIPLVPPHSCI